MEIMNILLRNILYRETHRIENKKPFNAIIKARDNFDDKESKINDKR